MTKIEHRPPTARQDGANRVEAVECSSHATQLGRWFVLRSRPAQTAQLAASLQSAGIDAWTPIERVERRLSRSKVKERFKAALTPTYVFVREVHLPLLRGLEGAAVTQHPHFTIFRFYEETVLIDHRTLHPMREREQDSYRASLPASGKHHQGKGRGKPFSAGDVVTLAEGPFAGLPCHVEMSNGRSTSLRLTLFGSTCGVKIETSRLRENGVAKVASAA